MTVSPVDLPLMLLAMKLTLIKHVCLMKKSLYKIGMLAVAALAFAGCNRETEIEQDVTGTHVVTVQVTKDFDTRTAIVEGATEASYVWTEGDEAYFHIYENGAAATSVSMTLDADGLATFTASFPNSNAESYEYTARYFDEESSNHNPLIKANQKPTLTSFDPSADVLIAAPQTKNAAATQLQFALKRLVSVNKMTLKGLTPGEKIESVELASTDKNFSANYVLSSESYSAAGKKLTFDYSELATAVVDNEGTFPVYFVSAPVEDATFSVKVTTDQNVYLRDNFTSKLTLTVSQVKRFGIQLGDYGSPISTGTIYTLVESADQICDGATYIIVGTNAAGDEFRAAGAQTNNNRSGEIVTPGTDGSITLDNTTNVHSFTLGVTAEGNYTLLDNDGVSGYLYAAGTATTGSNYLRSSVDLIDNAYWTITFTDGNTSIINANNTNTPIMQYNRQNKFFSCYNKASQAPVSLYVDEATCTPTPRIVVTPAAIEDVDYKGGSFNDLNYELRNLDGESATITFDGEVVVNAMADPEMAGRINYLVSPNGIEEDREGWIKISAGTVEKKVLVSQHAAPSHEIILDGVSADGVVYVGPNVNDETTITVLSSYYWVASATCDGVENSFEIDTEEGNLDEEESDVTEITITAKVANDGEERYLGDIDIDNEGDEPTIISVWQRADVGDGTLAHPYTASKARELALAGDTGTYYIKGIVSKVQNQFDANYGTGNFWISEDGLTQTFEAYKIKYFGNVDWVEGNAKISAGDEIVVYGKLTTYGSGSNVTPETASGHLVSLNGKTKALTVSTLVATPDDNTKTIAVTWTAVSGSSETVSYAITCGDKSYESTSAGSYSFTMANYGTYAVTVVASASDAVSSTATTNVTLNNPSSTTKDYYKLVTSINDITEGTYVVGALRSQTATNNFYFGTASVSSGDWVVSDKYVTVAADNGVRRFEIANLPSGAVEFTLTGNNTDGFTISNGANYLYYTEPSNRKLAFATTGSSQKWTVSAVNDALITGGIALKAVTASGNYTISENSTAVGAIRGYASTTVYRAIYLFKKVNE